MADRLVTGDECYLAHPNLHYFAGLGEYCLITNLPGSGRLTLHSALTLLALSFSFFFGRKSMTRRKKRNLTIDQARKRKISVESRKILLQYFRCNKFTPNLALAHLLADELKVPYPQSQKKANDFIRENAKKSVERFVREGRKRRKIKRSGDFYKSKAWIHLRHMALKNSEGVCNLCGASGVKDNPLHVDHIKPRSRYPLLALDLDNLQVLCSDCNMGKSNIFEDDWRGLE